MNLIEKVCKVLSRNDTGETKSHQSGISIPKKIANTSVFPKLGTESLNPRVEVNFYDEEGELWKLQYIYYNDAFFGKPANKSHNEFRLTCIKGFISKYDVHAGDEVCFSIDDNGVRHIAVNKAVDVHHDKEKDEEGFVVIKIGTKWKNIRINMK